MMIRITIEMVPSGVETFAYKMHIIEISNTVRRSLQDRDYGDYTVKVSRKINRKTGNVAWHKTGTVTNFPRAAKNVVHLLARSLNELGYK